MLRHTNLAILVPLLGTSITPPFLVIVLRNANKVRRRSEGEVGEEVQGSVANLGVVGVGSEGVRKGDSTAEQKRRRSSSKSGELRRARAGAARFQNFTRGRGR